MEFFFNICCLIAVIVSLFAGIRFWKSYEKTKIDQFKNFSFGFLLISLGYLMLSLPDLISFDPSWIQIDFIITDISLLFAEFFLIPATFSFLKYSPRVQRVFLWFIPIVFVLYVLLNIIFFAPAIPLFSGDIYYWKNGIFWLHSMIWVPLATGAGFIGTWFLFGARKIKDKKLFWRSASFGITGVSIFVAGILFWYFKFFNPSSIILMISGIIGDMGFLSAVAGSFLYQSSQETLVEKVN